jgi:hypothetical protein
MKTLNIIRFEVLTVKMSMLVVWVAMPCGLIGKYQCFRGTYCLSLLLNIHPPKLLHPFNSVFAMHCIFQECNMPWGYCKKDYIPGSLEFVIYRLTKTPEL